LIGDADAGRWAASPRRHALNAVRGHAPPAGRGSSIGAAARPHRTLLQDRGHLAIILLLALSASEC